MEPKMIANGILQAVFKLFLIVGGLAVLYYLNNLIIYFVIAAVISLMGRPITVFLKNKLKFNGMLAAGTTLTLFVFLLLGLLSLFFPLLFEQSNNLSLLDIDQLKNKLESLIQELSLRFSIDNSFWSGLLESESLLQSINLGFLPDFLNGLLNVLSSFSVALFSVVFISFFPAKRQSASRTNPSYFHRRSLP